MFPGLVAELVRLKVDVLVATATQAIRAAKQMTNTIPIVMASSTDPVAAGFVANLAHPDGNITGVIRLTRELSRKRLELLKEAVPRISRVGVIWDGDAPGPAIALKEYEAGARSLKLEFHRWKYEVLILIWTVHFRLPAGGGLTRSSW